MCGGGGDGGAAQRAAEASQRQERLAREQMEMQRKQFEEQMALQRQQMEEQRSIAEAPPPPAPEPVATAAASAIEAPRTAASGVPGAGGATEAMAIPIRAGFGRRRLRTDAKAVAGGAGGLNIPTA